MNSAYIGKLMELAEKDHDVIHMLADSGTGYDEMFRRNFPDQIYNFLRQIPGTSPWQMDFSDSLPDPVLPLWNNFSY